MGPFSECDNTAALLFEVSRIGFTFQGQGYTLTPPIAITGVWASIFFTLFLTIAEIIQSILVGKVCFKSWPFAIFASQLFKWKFYSHLQYIQVVWFTALPTKTDLIRGITLFLITFTNRTYVLFKSIWPYITDYLTSGIHCSVKKGLL